MGFLNDRLTPGDWRKLARSVSGKCVKFGIPTSMLPEGLQVRIGMTMKGKKMLGRNSRGLSWGRIRLGWPGIFEVRRLGQCTWDNRRGARQYSVWGGGIVAHDGSSGLGGAAAR